MRKVGVICFPVVKFLTLAIRNLIPLIELLSLLDQNHYVRLFKRIATENYFLVVCLCCATLSTFESMNEVLKCDDFNKSNWIVRSHCVCLSFYHFKNLKKVESGHACNICKLSRTPL